MSIKETLQHDLTEAIRSRDELTSGTIRMVLTAITMEEVAGKESRELSDAEVITVLSREAKKRREASEAFADGGRADRAKLESDEGQRSAGLGSVLLQGGAPAGSPRVVDKP